MIHVAVPLSRCSGHPVEVVERRPHAAARQVPSRPPAERRPSFSISTRRAWTIRLKLHANAFRLTASRTRRPPRTRKLPKPVGAVSARSSFPRYQPLCHTACATPRPRPAGAAGDVQDLHQVRLEDVRPRTPVQLHWATGSQGAGLACCPGKVDLYPLRRIPARTPRWTGGRRGTP